MKKIGDALRIMRLRTELAFLCGDAVHGGPDRKKEISALRAKIARLLSPSLSQESGTGFQPVEDEGGDI